jgi:peptidoglycan-associated lipoprotein
MGRQGYRVVVISLLVFGLGATGCASRAATTDSSGRADSSAPSPSGSGTAGTAQGGWRPTSEEAARSGPTGAQRPSPIDFVVTPDLKDIYFDFDRADIRPDAAETLDANAGWLKANPAYLVLIEGHTDERGTNEYNLALGDRRARAARNYLVSHGVPATRITMISYGEERAVCSAVTESCWSQNRRAHFGVRSR